MANATNNAITRDLQRLAHPTSVPTDASVQDKQRYSLVQYDAQFVQVISGLPPTMYRSLDRTFQVPGDTIRVLELDGSDVIGISTGKGLPFVPVREGATFRRPFSSFTIRNLAYPLVSSITGTPTRALLLVSFGDVLEDPREASKDFFAGFPTWQDDAPIGGISVFKSMPGTSPLGSDNPVVSPLRFGGTLMLQNLSVAQPLYLYHGEPGTFDPTSSTPPYPCPTISWPIQAGSTLVLVFEGASRRYVNAYAGALSASALHDICVACSAGTVRFAAMLSRFVGDMSDSEANTTPGVPRVGTQS